MGWVEPWRNPCFHNHNAMETFWPDRESLKSASARIALMYVVIVVLLPLIVVAIKGDLLFVGLWYYLAVPIGIILLPAIIQPRASFLMGAATAVSVSFLAYQGIQLSLSRPEGLLALGHLFSAPGALIGAIALALVSRLRKWTQPSLLLGVGFGGTIVGFLVAQVIVCSTKMYCGALTWWPLVRFLGTCAGYAGDCH